MSSIDPLSPILRQALERLDPSLGGLEVSSQLRKTLGAEQSRQVAELHQLRKRAKAKLGEAGRLLLTKKGYEQATGQQVADYRASRIARWMGQNQRAGWIVDGTAGIGGDSMALLRAGVSRLVANELDQRSASLLQVNLQGYGSQAWVVRSRIETLSLMGEAILLDPDRRSAGKGNPGATGPRQGSPSLWSPSWEACLRVMQRIPNVCIKLAPGVDITRLALPDDRPHAWQWISMGGELKEATLWSGPWASAKDGATGFQLACEPGQQNVTVLGRDGSLRGHWSAEPLDLEPLEPGAARDVAWIVEPDPAVIRAGLVGALAQQHQLTPLAEECVYLGGSAPAEEGLLASYRVLAHCALDRKRVRAMLAAHGIGPLVVKKRGHASSAEELAKRYAGKGQQRGLLIVARLGASHHAYLVDQPNRKK